MRKAGPHRAFSAQPLALPAQSKHHSNIEGEPFRIEMPEISQKFERTGGGHDPCRPGRLVLRRLGGHRVSRAQAARLSRGRLSLRIFRHDRNQHVVLPAAAARALPALDRTRLRQSPVRVHREALAEIHARAGRGSGRRARRPRGIRRAARRRKIGRRAAPVSVFVPPDARKTSRT